MALFVSLVVVLLLFVIVYQLWHCSIMETRIAQNQRGYHKSALAIQSMLAYSIALLQEELRQDVEGDGEEQLAGALGDTGTAAGGTGAAVGQSMAGNVASLQSGTTAAAATSGGVYDSVHEQIFQPRTQSLNNVSMKVQITDCERRINLNKLFQYVNFWKREQESVGKIGEETDETGAADAAGGAGATRTTGGGNANDASAAANAVSEDERDELADILGPMGELAEDGAGTEAEEWVEPDQLQLEGAERLVAYLVIHMMETNMDSYGLEYKRLYNADEVGRAIVNYVLGRKRSRTQNFIFDTRELLQIEEVTPELYNGPVPFELTEQGRTEMDPENVQEGYQRDEFGDITYRFGYFQQDDSGIYTEDYGMFSDFATFKEEFGLAGSLRPGVTSLSDNPLPDNVDGTGVERRPQPIGLKHLFCTFSNGTVNLNTAPLEVIMALLQGGDSQGGAWDPEIKLDMAQSIILWRDQYTEEYLQELEEEELGYGYEEEEEELFDVQSLVGTEDLQTNVYKTLQDLNKIEFDGENVFEQYGADSIDSGNTETAPAVLLRKDLEKVKAFKSEYFNVRIVAQEPGFRQEAEFVVHRDLKNKVFSVVYYREPHE